MAYMLQIGFLGTRAPLYMDIFVLLMIFLPILIGISVWQAVQKRYGVHMLTQTLLFGIVLIGLGYVEYTLYYQGGFKQYAKQGSFNLNMVFYFLIFHTLIAIGTMVLWFSVIQYARGDRQRRALPGLYSKGHKRMAKMVSMSIFLLSLSVIILYWMLFVS